MTARIDELPTTILQSRDHEVPAMKDGLTVRLTVGQFLSLIEKGDITGFLEAVDTPVDAADAEIVATDVQAAVKELSLSSGTAVTTISDTHLMGVRQGSLFRKITWLNIKAAIATALGGMVSGATSKATPVNADSLLLSDSAASNGTKKLTLANLVTFLGGTFAALAGATFTGVVRVKRLEATDGGFALYRAGDVPGANPIILLDGNDFLQYDIAGNVLALHINGAVVASFNAAVMGDVKGYIDAWVAASHLDGHQALGFKTVAKTVSGTVAHGATTAGSNLNVCAFDGTQGVGGLSGTWRCNSSVVNNVIPGLMERTL